MIISSANNDRIKQAVALRSRRQRRQSGLMLIEGATEIRRALAAGATPVTLFLPVGSDHDLGSVPDESILEVDGPALDKLAVRGATSPVLIAEQVLTGLGDLPPATVGASLYLVVEAIEKPGNLGAMIRTADGAGVDGLIVADPTADLFGPNVIRASIGAVFAIPSAMTSSAEAIAWLQRRHVKIVATTPAGGKQWCDADLSGSVAVVVGAEHQGLSAMWMGAADEHVALPMRGVGDSLNAATTAAVLLYEAVRQRNR